MFSIKNKIVLLTGATGGIGKKIALEMSEYGAKLILTGTKEDRLKDLCKSLPNESIYIVSNFNNYQNIKDFLDKVWKKKQKFLAWNP